MKNAKLLIPAVAVLALSSAAAVTGTVAWFTASKTASAQITGLSVINTEGNMKVTALDGHIGLNSVNVQAKTNAITATHLPLRDGSVDFKTGNLFAAYLDEASGTTTSGPAGATDFYKSLGTSDYADAETKTVYRASKLLLHVDVDSNTIGNDTYGLFVDVKSKGLTISGSTESKISSAFRVAFVATGKGTGATTNYAVWAPDKSTTLTTSNTYVNSATAAAAKYLDEDLIDETKGDESYDGASKNLLGNFTASVNTQGIDLTIFTWLEGEDANCTSEEVAKLSNITWSLQYSFNLLKNIA